MPVPKLTVLAVANSKICTGKSTPPMPNSFGTYSSTWLLKVTHAWTPTAGTGMLAMLISTVKVSPEVTAASASTMSDAVLRRAACWAALMPVESTFRIEPGAVLPVISAICAAVRPASIEMVPVRLTALAPDTLAASCAADMPVALIVASPAGVFETSAAMVVALKLASSERFSTVETAAMPVATAPSWALVMPVASIAMFAPPTKPVAGFALARSAAMRASLKAEVRVNDPPMPWCAMLAVLSATATSWAKVMPVASTVAAGIEPRSAVICSTEKAASMSDFAASQA